jgi:hypothetical protein
LDQNVEHAPVLIDGPPKPVLNPGDRHRDLIERPFVAGFRQPTPDLVGEGLAELEAPLPHGLMADHNATSREDLIDMLQAERKAEIAARQQS